MKATTGLPLTETTPSSGAPASAACAPEPDAVVAARQRLRGHVRETPCRRVEAAASVGDHAVFLKLEVLQHTGSFKERGARHVIARLEGRREARRGIVAASAGNHALGLAWHGGRTGLPVTLVMPRGAARVKVERCRRLGARVVLAGSGFAEAERHARDLARKTGAHFVHPFDDADVMAGQGTLGLELLEQVPEADVVIVPAGGGGLLAGVATAVKALKPSVRVVAVEPEAAPSLTGALRAAAPVGVAVGETLADGLAVPKIGARCFEAVRRRIDSVVTVSEAEIAAAMAHLFETERLVVEGAGATAFAALLAGRVELPFGARVVVPLTGGNVDARTFARALALGHARAGRLRAAAF